MTLLVVWREMESEELWCAADTRLSRRSGTLTDHGPKIFPVPVICHVPRDRENNWKVARRHSVGFAFCGSSIAATSTHALSSTCTQMLATHDPLGPAVSVKAIAELYRDVAEHQIRDICGRLCESSTDYFFEGIVFGYCLVQCRVAAFKITPQFNAQQFVMTLTEIHVPPAQNLPHAFGSGAEDFDRLYQEHCAQCTPDVLKIVRQMVAQGVNEEVGGAVQIGISSAAGFYCPLILDNRGASDERATFLGWDVSRAPQLDGYTIGYITVGEYVSAKTRRF